MSVAPVRGLGATRALCCVPALAFLSQLVTAQAGTWDEPISHGDHPYGCQQTTAIPRFYPIHASLIPTGHYRGRVLVWDASSGDSCRHVNGDRDQRWAILEPGFATDPPTLEKFNWQIQNAPPPPCGLPGGHQGLFCAGHAWLPNGKLMVAGGDFWEPATCQQGYEFVGSRMLCLFTPPTGPLTQGTVVGNAGPWHLDRSLDLVRARWYPTVVVTGSPADGPFIYIDVQGGVEFIDFDRLPTQPPAPLPGDEAYNSHEVYVYDIVLKTLTRDTRTRQPYPNAPGLFRLAASPGSPPDSLFYYPRSLYLSREASIPHGSPHGHIWVAGMPIEAGRYDLLMPDQWVGSFSVMPHTPPEYGTFRWLDEATAVRFPNLTPGLRDTIGIFGGLKTDNLLSSHNVTDEVFVLDAKQANPVWQSLQPMSYPRKFADSVLLPNGGILILGGGLDNTPGAGVRVPELYLDGNWSRLEPEATDRAYHSAALLLPDGRVLSCGGDTCDAGMEYQIFNPPYLVGTRPQIVALPQDNLFYATTFMVDVGLAVGQTLQLVLMAPGSVTHGHDANQRYYQMAITHQTVIQTTPNQIVRATASPPANRTEVPPGIYMLFAVTGMGTPSVARWITLN